MKVRLRFAKTGKVCFTSHRDVARMWERALRRVALPVAWSEGFSPRPKLSFGLALSTGHESVAEYLDVELTPEADDIDVDGLPALLSPALPVGVDVTAACVLEPGAPSLQEAVTATTWRIEVVSHAPEVLQQAVERALSAESLVVTRTRKGKEVTDDIRPAIRSVTVVGPTDAGAELEAELAVHPRSLRPAELLGALAAQASGVATFTEGRVRRTHQWIERSGARAEPLLASAPLDATLPPHAELRAS